MHTKNISEKKLQIDIKEVCICTWDSVPSCNLVTIAYSGLSIILNNS